MKKLLLFIGIFLLHASLILAQAPQSFKYQAIARDDLGSIIADQDVSLRISVLESSVSGTAVYVETHIVHTNQFGLLNIVIGNGTIVSGDI